MKRFWTGLLTVCLLLIVLPTHAGAAEESRNYTFDLTANGAHEVQAKPGDVLTVTLMLRRTDDVGGNEMYAMQDEIGYDDTFFEVVSGSVLLSDGITTEDLALPSGGRALYLNHLSLVGGQEWPRERMIGSFQIRVLGKQGASQLKNQNCLVSKKDGNGSYNSAAQDLTVVVTTDCRVHFETNGGSQIGDMTVLYGEKMTKPQDPVREGYWFTGWYRDVSRTEKWDFDKDTVQGNMTLYAGWSEGEPPAAHGPETWDTWQWSVLVTATVALLLLVSLPVLRRRREKQ